MLERSGMGALLFCQASFRRDLFNSYSGNPFYAPVGRTQ